ncbi:hypothetical protein BDY19DRAFT_22673 [Irpex rosettiformis]|uniref:Uncharacterized protein n=1 Tax=Irpex rosettiformis TaxID=378272 RepID=A0ACB8UK26_9APHY|nr:hypothetical protein BDY19DRAFT_22673 [Irpex rosettiformis]
MSTAYAEIAPLAWMIWDMVINISDEIECIWARPTTWVKFAYVFLRYVPIIQCIVNIVLGLRIEDHFSTSFCKNMMIEKYTILLLVIMVVQACLAVRLYALYFEHTGILLPVISLAFGAEMTIMAVTLALVINKVAFTQNCVVRGSLPTSNIAFWLAAVIFELLIFVCNIAKYRQHRRMSSIRPKRLLKFSQDGVGASALILVALLLSTVLHQLHDLSVDGVGYNWTIGIMSCTGANVLLSHRRSGNYLDSEEYPSTWSSFPDHNQVCEPCV